MSNPTDVRNKCIIVVADLFAKINHQRKLLHRTPIENQALATRCTLRFNVDEQRGVDFTAEKILIAPKEVDVLEKMVNELFGVYFEGEVRKLCAKSKVPEPKPAADLDSFLPQAALAPEITEKTGIISRIKGLFGAK